MLQETPGSTDYTEEACRQSAQEANLRYVRDTEPGIRRKRSGKGFRYVAPNGERITNEKELERIHSLAIPPAYQQVWICASPSGHLQATGRDERRRKQYRYHPKWEEIRNETKFYRMAEFAQVLPLIRERIEKDASGKALNRPRVLAAAVKLMDQSLIRVGNEKYAQENKTYGLTTLRRKHASVDGNRIILEFTGKSGKPWRLDIRDRRIASTLRQCEEIPGYELFKYVDESGAKCAISSEDLNAYIQEITGKPFTAKDFRTHAATARAIAGFAALPDASAKKEKTRRLNAAIRAIAAELGHTPAICRKCYIHPRVIDAYEQGSLSTWLKGQKDMAEHELVARFLESGV